VNQPSAFGGTSEKNTFFKSMRQAKTIAKRKRKTSTLCSSAYLSTWTTEYRALSKFAPKRTSRRGTSTGLTTWTPCKLSVALMWALASLKLKVCKYLWTKSARVRDLGSATSRAKRRWAQLVLTLPKCTMQVALTVKNTRDRLLSLRSMIMHWGCHRDATTLTLESCMQTFTAEIT